MDVSRILPWLELELRGVVHHPSIRTTFHIAGRTLEAVLCTKMFCSWRQAMYTSIIATARSLCLIDITDTGDRLAKIAPPHNSTTRHDLVVEEGRIFAVPIDGVLAAR
jgi:hypothetical protein